MFFLLKIVLGLIYWENYSKLKEIFFGVIYFRNYASDIICGYDSWSIINSTEFNFLYDGEKQVLKT